MAAELLIPLAALAGTTRSILSKAHENEHKHHLSGLLRQVDKLEKLDKVDSRSNP